MKKKNNKIQRTKRETVNDSDRGLDSLNSELGSFGLEPPKHYKREESDRAERSDNRKKSSVKKNKKAVKKKENVNLTPQQRRANQDKLRKQKKLRRKIVYTVLLSVSIIAVIVVLSLTVLFKINTISVTGNEIYSEEEILAVLPIQNNDNLFLADTGGASEKLRQTLPYIYQVDIKRKIPSTIKVMITETPVIYSVENEDETYTLLDDTFKVLEVNAAEVPEKTIIISNCAINSAIAGQRVEFADDQMAQNLTEMAQAIERLTLDQITEMYSIDINNNYMIYEDRITFKLGSTENLDNKIYSALTATEKLNESNPSVSGTMTVTDGKQIYFTEE